MKKSSVKREILQANRETIEDSTLHGLPHVFRSKYILIKAIWIICIGASFGYCCYSIVQCFIKFFDYQVTTHLTITNKQDVAFPIVKICNLNYNVYLNENNTLINSSQIKDMTDIQYLMLSYMSKAKYYNLDEINRIGIANLSSILINCKFNAMDCSADDFEFYFDYTFGNCYLFNSGRNSKGRPIPLKRSIQVGSLNGLNLEIFVGDSSKKLNELSYENGLNILISNEPEQSFSSEGLRAVPGQTTHMAMTKYSIKHLPKPYSDCIADLTTENSYGSECFRKTLQMSKKRSTTYHYMDCVYICFQKFVGKTCQCQQFQLEPYYPNMRTCFDTQDINCTLIAWPKFLEKPGELSECDCPIECSQEGYTISYSSAEYPTAYYASVLANRPIIQSKFPNKSSIIYDDLRDSLVNVKIYFGDHRETIIEHEVKMTTSDLIATIGGTIGLFLGLSLLSLIEIVEIIAQTLIIGLSGIRKNSAQNGIRRTSQTYSV